MLHAAKLSLCAAALFNQALALPHVEVHDDGSPNGYSQAWPHHKPSLAYPSYPWWDAQPSASASAAGPATATALSSPSLSASALKTASSAASGVASSTDKIAASSATALATTVTKTAASISALLSSTRTAASSDFPAAPTSTALPVVDLGYELHQASGFNASGGYYNFSNIRYAAPPVGNLRFRAPVAPAVDRSAVQTGDQARICIQAFPPWFNVQEQFITEYLSGQPITVNQSTVDAYNLTLSASTVAPQDPTATEDCLFLDVFVPQSIFHQAGTGAGAPVLVWIYGGGYTVGSKTGSGNPAGLILRSEQDGGSPGVIFVAMNYRLGAFGWLPGVEVEADGKSNAGLYDQRFALEWVQAHISKFGGDPARVTVFGESAGGGSIMHQMTAYGGKAGPVPFAQAVPQSPGFLPITSNYAQQSTFDRLLELTGAADLAALRTLPEQALVTANSIQVGEAAYGTFVYGPVVDGDFVPALPGQLLLQGEFDASLRVMTGHNTDEGLLFTSPFVQTPADLLAQLSLLFPTIQPGAAAYVADVLYPPVYDGSQGYADPVARNALLHSEAIFTCNANYLARAYGNDTFGYLFAVAPGLHGMDIPYTFFNGPSASVANDTIAAVLQDYIVSFAVTGKPSASAASGAAGAIPPFTAYGADAGVQQLAPAGISRVHDPAANARCLWWQKALYM